MDKIETRFDPRLTDEQLEDVRKNHGYCICGCVEKEVERLEGIRMKFIDAFEPYLKWEPPTH